MTTVGVKELNKLYSCSFMIMSVEDATPVTCGWLHAAGKWIDQDEGLVWRLTTQWSVWSVVSRRVHPLCQRCWVMTIC